MGILGAVYHAYSFLGDQGFPAKVHILMYRGVWSNNIGHVLWWSDLARGILLFLCTYPV